MSQQIAYDFDQAALMVGYSTRTLRRAAADGMLIVRYGSKTKPVIRHDDLDSWLLSLPTEAPK